MCPPSGLKPPVARRCGVRQGDPDRARALYKGGAQDTERPEGLQRPRPSPVSWRLSRPRSGPKTDPQQLSATTTHILLMVWRIPMLRASDHERRLVLWAGALLLMCALAPAIQAQPAQQHGAESAVVDAPAYIQWLEEHSMLHQAAGLARQYSASAVQWQRPYALPQPRAAASRASVWFTAYPASTIGPPGASVLRTLADERLWRVFEAIGIQAVHTGPMKRAGGVRGSAYTPSVDGGFDRIGFEIDPDFGTEAEYQAMVATARAHGALVVGDIIPGHTGKGPDFR